MCIQGGPRKLEKKSTLVLALPEIHNLPACGLSMTPPIPFPKPLSSPATPSFLAPSIGWVTRPAIPSYSPKPNPYSPVRKSYEKDTVFHYLSSRLQPRLKISDFICLPYGVIPIQLGGIVEASGNAQGEIHGRLEPRTYNSTNALPGTQSYVDRLLSTIGKLCLGLRWGSGMSK